ncbi:hypothetical protein T492DRAFT_868562, partial [Pavlovales sp. CCMP2436]
MFQPVCLPPNVDGAECGEVRLQIDHLRWAPGLASRKAHVRVKWWGERGGGTLFRPTEAPRGPDAPLRKPGSSGAANPLTVVYYPFTCDVPTLMRYLDDMRTLVLDVTDGLTHKIIGHAFLHLGLVDERNAYEGRLLVYDEDERETGQVGVSLAILPHPVESVGAHLLVGLARREAAGEEEYELGSDSDEDDDTPPARARSERAQPGARVESQSRTEWPLARAPGLPASRRSARPAAAAAAHVRATAADDELTSAVDENDEDDEEGVQPPFMRAAQLGAPQLRTHAPDALDQSLLPAATHSADEQALARSLPGRLAAGGGNGEGEPARAEALRQSEGPPEDVGRHERAARVRAARVSASRSQRASTVKPVERGAAAAQADPAALGELLARAHELRARMQHAVDASQPEPSAHALGLAHLAAGAGLGAASSVYGGHGAVEAGTPECANLFPNLLGGGGSAGRAAALASAALAARAEVSASARPFAASMPFASPPSGAVPAPRYASLGQLGLGSAPFGQSGLGQHAAFAPGLDGHSLADTLSFAYVLARAKGVEQAPPPPPAPPLLLELRLRALKATPALATALGFAGLRAGDSLFVCCRAGALAPAGGAAEGGGELWPGASAVDGGARGGALRMVHRTADVRLEGGAAGPPLGAGGPRAPPWPEGVSKGGTLGARFGDGARATVRWEALPPVAVARALAEAYAFARARGEGRRAGAAADGAPASAVLMASVACEVWRRVPGGEASALGSGAHMAPAGDDELLGIVHVSAHVPWPGPVAALVAAAAARSGAELAGAEPPGGAPDVLARGSYSAVDPLSGRAALSVELELRMGGEEGLLAAEQTERALAASLAAEQMEAADGAVGRVGADAADAAGAAVEPGRARADGAARRPASEGGGRTGHAAAEGQQAAHSFHPFHPGLSVAHSVGAVRLLRSELREIARPPPRAPGGEGELGGRSGGRASPSPDGESPTPPAYASPLPPAGPHLASLPPSRLPCPSPSPSAGGSAATHGVAAQQGWQPRRLSLGRLPGSPAHASRLPVRAARVVAERPAEHGGGGRRPSVGEAGTGSSPPSARSSCCPDRPSAAGTASSSPRVADASSPARAHAHAHYASPSAAPRPASASPSTTTRPALGRRAGEGRPPPALLGGQRLLVRVLAAANLRLPHSRTPLPRFGHPLSHVQGLSAAEPQPRASVTAHVLGARHAAEQGRHPAATPMAAEVIERAGLPPPVLSTRAAPAGRAPAWAEAGSCVLCPAHGETHLGWSSASLTLVVWHWAADGGNGGGNGGAEAQCVGWCVVELASLGFGLDSLDG